MIQKLYKLYLFSLMKLLYILDAKASWPESDMIQKN